MKHLEFSLAEKLSIIRILEDVIEADGRIDNREVDLMRQLSYFLNFDMSLVQEARKMAKKEALLILSGMSKGKRQSLGLTLKEMAGSDGKITEEELMTLYSIFKDAQINR